MSQLNPLQDISLVSTEDGSLSLHIPSMGEGYHSTSGAVSESMHVYVNPNLAVKGLEKDSIHVFEMGFGTGLNAFLSWIYAHQNGKRIVFHSVELNPLPFEIYSQLNYAQVCKSNNDVFLALHQAPWNEEVVIDSHLSLLKHQGAFSKHFALEEDFYDCVFYDAFAPQFELDLWGEEVFGNLYKSMKKEALLTTYCCKGAVKRAMKASGLAVEKIPGFAHKREMLRGRKP